MVKPKRSKLPASRSSDDRDLVPNEASEAFKLIERAAREGQRVSTRDLSDDDLRALLIGRRTER